MSEPEALRVANYHCLLGENPRWNEREGRLYWGDIDTGRLFRVSHATAEHECFYRGETIGGFTFQSDDSLLLFEADRIARLDLKTGERRVLRAGIDPGMERFNDVIADPEGRVFAGTIGRTEQSGGLYRVDPDGTIERIWAGTEVANGMGFSVDLSRFYWTCSTTSTIFVASYDRATGALRDRRPFYVASEGEGTPDGLTVDSDDAIWTARWGGHAVLRISREGQVIDRLRLPVPSVSSATFGGPELDTLYVTTAGGKLDTETEDGTLYAARVQARGVRTEFRSRILV